MARLNFGRVSVAEEIANQEAEHPRRAAGDIERELFCACAVPTVRMPL